jgi:hypothetical protein
VRQAIHIQLQGDGRLECQLTKEMTMNNLLGDTFCLLYNYEKIELMTVWCK